MHLLRAEVTPFTQSLKELEDPLALRGEPLTAVVKTGAQSGAGMHQLLLPSSQE
jgi:hypothetical protein